MHLVAASYTPRPGKRLVRILDPGWQSRAARTTHADEGEFGRDALTAFDGHAVLGLAHRPQSFDGSVEKALPGLRAHGKSEQRVIVPPFEAIASWRLMVRPASRQIGKARDPVVDNGAVPCRRSDNFMVFREHIEQLLQRVT